MLRTVLVLGLWRVDLKQSGSCFQSSIVNSCSKLVVWMGGVYATIWGRIGIKFITPAVWEGGAWRGVSSLATWRHVAMGCSGWWVGVATSYFYKTLNVFTQLQYKTIYFFKLSCVETKWKRSRLQRHKEDVRFMHHVCCSLINTYSINEHEKCVC